jgi:hypothetical protein
MLCFADAVKFRAPHTTSEHCRNCRTRELCSLPKTTTVSTMSVHAILETVSCCVDVNHIYHHKLLISNGIKNKLRCQCWTIESNECVHAGDHHHVRMIASIRYTSLTKHFMMCKSATQKLAGGKLTPHKNLKHALLSSQTINIRPNM